MPASDSTNLPATAPPAVAIICNSLPPYRIHLHQRIAHEMPEIKAWTLCTMEGQDSRWVFNPPAGINTVTFALPAEIGRGHRFDLTSFRTGGQVTEWMQNNAIQAVMLLGYNDLGRLRVIRYCRRHRIPCFVFGDSNIRGDTATGLRAWLKRIFLGWVVRNTAGQFACGRLGKAFFIKYGGSGDRIDYVPYEPDYDQIMRITPERIAAALARFGLSPVRRRIVFSGRFIPIKRPDHIILAFCALAADRPDWDLLMIGDGPMREELHALLPADLKRRVVFTGFLHEQAAISALYRGSDVLSLPSTAEPWALVINEAAAAGMAIIASDVVGAAAELVRDRVNGRIHPADDLERLMECLRDVTSADQIDRYKAASGQVLADWRSQADPVDGFRHALIRAGVIGAAR